MSLFWHKHGLLLLLGVSAATAGTNPGAQDGSSRWGRLDPAVRATIERADQRLSSLPAGASSEDRANALSAFASVLLAHDQNDSATTVIDDWLAVRPDAMEAHYLRALARLGIGDDEGALRGFDRALELDPGYVAAWLRRGELHLMRGALEDARRDFSAALERSPGSAAALSGLGRVALQAGDAQGAVTALQQALLAAPEAGRLRTPLALALRQLGRTEEARAALAGRNDRAVWFADPLFENLGALRRNPAVVYEQGRQLAAAGNLVEARQALAEAVTMAPDEPVFLTEYGRVLMLLGALSESEEVLDRAASLAPRDGLVAELRARVAMAQGETQRAEEQLSTALTLMPAANDLRVELARLYFRSERYSAAAVQFDELADRVQGAEWSYARYWGGVAHALSGQCSEALAAMNEVFEDSQRRDGWAMLGLGRLAAVCPVDDATRTAQLERAQALYAQHPGVETAVTLAMHAAAAGRFNDAIRFQQKAIEQAMLSAEPAAHVASLQALLSRFEAQQVAPRAYLSGSGLLSLN